MTCVYINAMDTIVMPEDNTNNIVSTDIWKKGADAFQRQTQQYLSADSKDTIQGRDSDDSEWFVEWIEKSLTLDSYLNKSKSSTFRDLEESVTLEDTCESSKNDANFDNLDVRSDVYCFYYNNSFTEGEFEEFSSLHERSDTSRETDHGELRQSKSVEKITWSSFDERDDKISEKIRPVTSMEKRQQVFHDLVLQYDQFRQGCPHGESLRSLNTALRSNVLSSKREIAIHNPIKISSPTKSKLSVEGPILTEFGQNGSCQWKKDNLNNLERQNVTRTQSRACRRLYQLAKKKLESENKTSCFNTGRPSSKFGSRSTKSTSPSTRAKTSNISPPVFERLYSLAPKRTRKLEIRKELRWK